LLVAESEKFRGKYSVACCGNSEILSNFFIMSFSEISDNFLFLSEDKNLFILTIARKK